MNASRSSQARLNRQSQLPHSVHWLALTFIGEAWFLFEDVAYFLGVPSIFPKANVSAIISTLILAVDGTLTATGTKPRPQQDPGKIATSNTAPVSLSRILNSGDLPIGFQPTYCSPALP